MIYTLCVILLMAVINSAMEYFRIGDCCIRVFVQVMNKLIN
jgi:hypothetical protein